MYYESRDHRTRPVSSAAEAAALIVRNQAAIYDALTWTANGRTLCAVDDGHIDRPWSEVAVIRLDGERPVQIESITFAWLEGEEGQRILEGARYLERCEVTDFAMGPTAFPLDGNGYDVPATFACGCCGAGFRSTLAEQGTYDQDAGFGICPACVKFIGRAS